MGTSMPVEPTPPPSPRGKSSSPPKHLCPTSTPCAIRLSDIGRRYHSFPKSTFHARFTLPAVPKTVLRYFIAHPFAWTWTTRAGPNKGKSFQVPTIPTSCQKTSHKAIRWIVAVFHSFKTHLNPIALEGDSGRVLPAWVRLYQNNFLVHIQGQAKALSSPTRLAIPHKAEPPTTPTPSTATEIAELHQELSDLHREFSEFQQAHKACCPPSSPSVPVATQASEDLDPPDDELTPLSSPLSSPPSSPVEVPTLYRLRPWLWHVKNHPELPSLFHNIVGEEFIGLRKVLPEDVTRAIKLVFKGTPPFYLGYDSSRTLYAAQCARRSQVTATLNLPADTSAPMTKIFA